MNWQLDEQIANELCENENIENITVKDIEKAILSETDISSFAPDGYFRIDPRDNHRIVYNSKRAKRPHDNKPKEVKPEEKPCVICKGTTTKILDKANLSKGYTFINKNLFPILFPFNHETNPSVNELSIDGAPSKGFHLLQWSSNLHEMDWHNMPVEDCTIVMQRLCQLEKSLLTQSNPEWPSNKDWGDEQDTRGFVSIIKNYGRLVGGSLVHGHQQIAYLNFMGKKSRDDLDFEKRHNTRFSSFMLKNNPADFMIKEYETATLVVPYFMRRPYDMFLLMKDTSKRWLFELNEQEVKDMAQGWQDAIQAILHIMPQIGREPAFNVTVHNGPGAGIYCEFLPYTQEWGGYEHQGVILCQDIPENVTENLKTFFAKNSAI
jgi:galactose-1-phosphate uridylyltransferase